MTMVAHMQTMLFEEERVVSQMQISSHEERNAKYKQTLLMCMIQCRSHLVLCLCAVLPSVSTFSSCMRGVSVSPFCSSRRVQSAGSEGTCSVNACWYLAHVSTSLSLCNTLELCPSLLHKANSRHMLVVAVLIMLDVML